MVGIYCSKLVHEFKNSTELLKVASGARGHKSCCGATLTSMIKYFFLTCDPENYHITKYLHNNVFVAPNWTQSKFLTLLCMFLGVLVPNYVAKYGVLRARQFGGPKCVCLCVWCVCMVFVCVCVCGGGRGG